ncbi:hypothetical protein T459_35753 [Capsicum annuum]|uniref:ATPase AAA-type core domain-containing protein n=1 Tax=Capsicum annuum TaxID=4072 RepID=A0A2G2UX05_CAPAN|nr:hypothetical protein T459_35753 [Capsicum annuum]
MLLLLLLFTLGIFEVCYPFENEYAPNVHFGVYSWGSFSISGASEENIRELFSKAYRMAPSIVFIDEIDAIASKTENLQKEMEQHIVTQLLTCMDESHRVVKPNDAEESA